MSIYDSVIKPTMKSFVDKSYSRRKGKNNYDTGRDTNKAHQQPTLKEATYTQTLVDSFLAENYSDFNPAADSAIKRDPPIPLDLKSG